MFDDFEIYDDCEPAGLELPTIQLEPDLLSDLQLTKECGSKEVLLALSEKGFKDRGISDLPNKQEYKDRLEYELNTFEELGFTDYILLNWEVIGRARESGYPVGDGRGSGAGSLVLFLLGVTNQDPIKHNLFFERFVSKNRAKKITDKHGKDFLVGSLAPDVDSDISHDTRGKVVEFIEEKHKGRTSKILTFNTFSSKLCIKEAAKYFYSIEEEEATKISDMIPKEHGIVMSLKKAREESEPFDDWCSHHPKAIQAALKIEGLNKNTGVHPSGIAICSQVIDNVIPLQRTKDGDLVSGYDMNDVADLMVKFDILGLRTLSIADRTCKKIGISFDDIDPNDPFIYQVLQDFNHPCGLFQISADTNFEVARKVKPMNLQELSDVVALARPAALQFVDDYIQQKLLPEKLGYNDQLDEILASSKNVMLYQEQTMKACHEVFGMSLDDAETLRRDIGKKKVEEIPKWQNRIFEAAEKNGISEEAAQYFWDVVEAGASYQFNLSHSICYGALAAKTVWLKYKYPQEFFTSILEISEFEQDPLEVVAEVNRELPSFNIKLLPPNLEQSSIDFTVEDGNIRYGLKSIKGVSDNTKKALEEFVTLEPKNKYDVFAYARQCGINIGVLSSLIYAGALGNDNRAKKALEAQAYNKLTEAQQRNLYKLGEKYKYDLLFSIKDVVEKETKGDNNRVIMSQKNFDNFKKKFEPYKELYSLNRKQGRLSLWWFEKELLGYSFSFNLIDCFNQSGDLINVEEFKSETPDSWRMVCQVDNFFIKISQNGNRYMRMSLSDDSAKVDMMFCDSPREEKLTNFLNQHKIDKKDIVVIQGSGKWISRINPIDAKIYTKTRQLKG